jgi:hypothetical protein
MSAHLESSNAGLAQRGSSPGWKLQRPSSEATCSRPLSRSKTWAGVESASARDEKARQRVLRHTKDPRGRTLEDDGTWLRREAIGIWSPWNPRRLSMHNIQSEFQDLP